MHRVFISYAHKDGARLALWLAERLKAAGHGAWLDRKRIEAGADWSAEIEQAIDEECNVALALLTPGSYESEICRAEVTRSLRRPLPVVPLLAAKDAPVPEHLQVDSPLDFSSEEVWEESFKHLMALLISEQWQGVALKEIKPSQAPPLPAHYVPRQDELQKLRQAVLSDEADRRAALTSPPGATGVGQQLLDVVRGRKEELPEAVLTAVHGMGGIGKSVMAMALGHDEVVRDAFPDGVAWVEIGKDCTDLVSKLQALGKQLGDTPGKYHSLEAAKKALGELLPKKSALIVLDNVWDQEQIAPFMVEAPCCRWLITTRDRQIADALEGATLELGVMTEAEAVALLEAWTGHPDPQYAEIAEKLGYLPLALKLVGARLRRDPELAAAQWLELYRGVEEIALRRVDHPHDAMTYCFDLSTKLLPAPERALYYSLGIFPEGEWLPEPVVLKLWRQLRPDLHEADPRLLADLALTLSELALIERDQANHTVRIHDLLHDYNRWRLGGDYVPVQQQLLDAYNAHNYPGLPEYVPWHKVEDDEYLYDHLAFHLEEATDCEELKLLFADQEWMNVRVPQCRWTYKGYVADVMLAWEQVAHPEALRQIEAGEEPLALADCIRYALIRTSINSLSANYVPELVARAVETGLWSVERALEVAKMVPDMEARVKLFILLLGTGSLTLKQREEAQAAGFSSCQAIEDQDSRKRALIAIAPQLNDDLLQQALAAALTIKNEENRADALTAIAPQLSGKSHETALHQALAAALAIEELFRPKALAAIAPHLSGDLLQQALAGALAINDEQYRAWALAAIAPQLSGDLLQQALAAASAIKDEYDKAYALAAIAPQLSGKSREQALQKALAAALAIEYEMSRAWALKAIAPQLSGDPLQQALAAVIAIKHENYRAKALAAIAPQLSGKSREQALQQALDAALAIEDEKSRAWALEAIAPHLSGDLLQQALAAVIAIKNDKNDKYRTDALEAMAPQLSGDLLEQALAAALAIKSDKYRTDALVAMAPQLSGDLLQQALAAALATEHEYNRASALAAIAPQLSGNLLQQALAVALAIKDGEYRAEALTALAAKVSWQGWEKALQQALAAALAIENEYKRAEALTALAPQLSGELLQQALAAALAIQDEQYRAEALTTLAAKVSGKSREKALQQVLAAALAIEDDKNRTEALTAVSPQLSGDLLQQALDAALAIEYEKYRADALVAITPHLSGKSREKALQQALDAALTIKNEEHRADALAAIAPQLNSDLLQQALAAALAIKYSLYRVRALAPIAPQLSGDLFKQAMAAALAEEDEVQLACVLAAIAPQLNSDLLQQALAAALAIEQEWYRAWALAAMAPQLSGDLLPKALDATLAIEENNDWKAEALTAMAPHLSGKSREKALQQVLAAALTIKHENYRAKALADIAPQLSADLLQQALIAALAINDEQYRARALSAIAPHLSGDHLQKALAAALAIKHENYRAKALAAIAPRSKGSSAIITCGLGYASCLSSANTRLREAVLELLNHIATLFPPPRNQHLLDTTAMHICEICFDWEWL